jgi:hypothetical protein
MKKQWFLTLLVAFGLFAPVAHAQQDAELPRDLHGLWWQPGDSGWAAAMFDHTDFMSSVLLVYDLDGRPIWYTAPKLDCFRKEPPWLNFQCDGAVYRVTGSYFGATSWRAADVTIRNVGRWSGYFYTPLFGGVGPDLHRSLDLTYSTDGPSLISHGQRPMRIQAVDPDASFLWQDGRYSGLWQNPDQNGWGVGVFVQNDSLYATLLVHGPDNQPRWYVALAKASRFDDRPDRIFGGDLYETTGWSDNDIALTGAKSIRRVGAFSIHFGAEPGDPARLNYSVDNIHVSKSIVRQR